MGVLLIVLPVALLSYWAGGVAAAVLAPNAVLFLLLFSHY